MGILGKKLLVMNFKNRIGAVIFLEWNRIRSNEMTSQCKWKKSNEIDVRNRSNDISSRHGIGAILYRGLSFLALHINETHGHRVCTVPERCTVL